MTPATTGRYQVANEEAPSIQIKDPDGDIIQISQVISTGSHKSLGYMQSVATSITTQEA
jgi:hypothetical protein